MNKRELASHLLYRVQHKGRWFRPLINFVAWKRLAAIYLPILVRRLDEAVRELCGGARCGLIYDGARRARIVVVDDLGAASTIGLRIGMQHVQIDGGALYWTAAQGGVDRLTTRLCEVVACKIALAG